MVKPTPADLFVDMGDGINYETQVRSLAGYITPNNRFFVRNHGATPVIDASEWRLVIDGTGVERPMELGYEYLRSMPQTSVTRVIECAGNGRKHFAEAHGRAAEGSQWGSGAIGAAEWSGVRLSDVLELAGVTGGARDVMPEGLDEPRMQRPIPLAKALRDDTILALDMNGEALPPDHGYPARMVVPGWLGTASIKWVGRLQVSEEQLWSHWNTQDYVLIGPDYAPEGEAQGRVITTMPPVSIVELNRPARLAPGHHVIGGRAYAGESRVSRVEYRVDDGVWREAALCEPNIAGSWVRWQFPWEAQTGQHIIRVRATDESGNNQPDSVPWNDLGCLYNAVVPHPVQVG